MFTRWTGVGEMMTLQAKGTDRKTEVEHGIEEQPVLSQMSEQLGWPEHTQGCKVQCCPGSDHGEGLDQCFSNLCAHKSPEDLLKFRLREGT